MNNFITKLLGIEDENILIEDYFNDEETNTIIIDVSMKRTIQKCPNCGSIDTHIHSHHTKNIIHSNFTTKKCILNYHQKRYRCNECLSTF